MCITGQVAEREVNSRCVCVCVCINEQIMQVKHVSSKESKKTKEYRMQVRHVSSK
jgi:hypothetical protein